MIMHDEAVEVKLHAEILDEEQQEETCEEKFIINSVLLYHAV
jgi:hypothetical protein